MNKLFTTLLLVFLSFTAAKSQFFNVSNINTDEFPIVSTIFVAKDSDNEFIKNATKEQFVLEEDGKTIPISKMSIECFEGGEIPELSITLIVDRSGSMIEPFDEKKPDDTPWKRVKDGVKSFLDGIKFVGGTQVSLVTFNGDSYESCPFTSNPQDIIDSLNTILPSSGTK